MNGTIAWNRLLIYFGASVLFLTEIYRTILISLTFVLYGPQIITFFQNLVLWGILIGFGTLTIGFYRLFNSYPPLLDTELYPRKKIRFSTILGFILTIFIGMLLVLPPLSYVSSNFQLLFSVFTSTIWFLFYIGLNIWIISYWKLNNEITIFRDIVENIRKLIHILFGLIIAGFWLLDIISWIIIEISIFNIDIVNIFYIIILILFIINQIFFFFEVRKFSYLIYG